jgi:hypothetical protein
MSLLPLQHAAAAAAAAAIAAAFAAAIDATGASTAAAAAAAAAVAVAAPHSVLWLRNSCAYRINRQQPLQPLQLLVVVVQH